MYVYEVLKVAEGMSSAHNHCVIAKVKGGTTWEIYAPNLTQGVAETVAAAMNEAEQRRL